MYVCKKLRLCVYLIQNGFSYLEEREDKFNPKFKIWIFENTPELRVSIEKYYNRDEFKNREV